MKKIILIIAVALIGVSASAQRIGVVAGITGPNSSLKESEIGAFDQYHLGLVSTIPVMSGLRLQPELIYKVKGTTVDQLGTGNAKVDTSVGFLEFGLEGQIGVGRDFIRVFGLAEPFIGYKLNDVFKDKSESEYNLSWDKTEYGLAVGGGIEFLQFIQASVKYFWNMGPVNIENIKDNTKKSIDGNFNGMTFSVAILF